MLQNKNNLILKKALNEREDTADNYENFQILESKNIKDFNYDKNEKNNIEKDNKNIIFSGKNNFNIVNNNNIKKNKKVGFKEPDFVEIFDVESYKKFNEENTSKDPYDYLLNNNNNEKKEDKKEKVLCSCIIL